MTVVFCEEDGPCATEVFSRIISPMAKISDRLCCYLSTQEFLGPLQLQAACFVLAL